MTEAVSKVKRELLLEGLDCANCAMKIEDGVRKMDGISSCSVNFVKQTLTFESSKDQDQLISEITKKIKKLEPHVSVRELVSKAAGNHPQRSRGHQGDGHAHDHGHSHEGHDHGAGGHSHDDAHGHDHGHSHDHGSSGIRVMSIRLAAGAVITAAAMLLPVTGWAELAMFLVAYLITGGDIVLQALRNILRGQVFDEYFLMSVATIGAFCVGQYPEGVAVMLFYQIGEMFQGIAVNRSRKSISAMMDLRPDYANLKTGGGTKQVTPEEVRVGDLIVVKPGEKIPLDGKVAEGRSMADTSALTGESVPRELEAGDEVLSGFINKNGVLTIEVTKIYGESTAAKILDLVQNASSNKAPTENFITKFARLYTPVVVIVALLLALVPPLVVSGATFSDWIYRALIFLVISCPCALVVSIPLGFFGGIGAASKAGILVKGSNYLEALNAVKYVVFDKTGTLTKGTFRVTETRPAHDGISPEQLLEYAAFAELHSSHPIAESIREAYGKEIDASRIQDYNEAAGHGVHVKLNGVEVLAGNAKLLKEEGIAAQQPDASGTVVYVAVNGEYAGYLLISDEVKEDAAQAVGALQQRGKQTVMLTGDARPVAEKVGKLLGVNEVHAELLPQDKVEHMERLSRLKQPKEKIAFVGDGMNDTPVLARADVGIAMGGLGSDAAIEAADIVIMTDEPSKIVTALGIAGRTRQIVWQNIVFALAVKGIFLLLGAFGIATMWEAVFSDVGVTLLAVLNAMRVLKLK